MATSIANAITESMAAGNKHYRNVKLVLNNIIGTIHISDLSLIEKMLNKYNLYRPTVDDVYKSILRSTRLYWNDVQGEKTIKDLLLTLTDVELSAVLYVNDIYHLRVYNDSFMREFIDVLSMRIENNTDKPLEVLENSEEFVLNLVHHICADDIKGKKVMSRMEKYFICDTGLRYTKIGYRDDDVSQLLENVVYMHLKAEGYEVYVGKEGDREIDFIAEKNSDCIYIQVSYLLATEEVVDREYRPLQMIKDSYPKLVLTLDKLPIGQRDGIKWMNLIDFLLK